MTGVSGLPQTGTRVVRSSEWTDGARAGERVQMFVDDVSGYSAMLMKIAPGPLGEAHAHDTIEQIYVIDGDFFDEDNAYQAGDFVVRMPGTIHCAGSRGGGTLLIAYAPLVEPHA